MGFTDKYKAAKERLEAAQQGLPEPTVHTDGLMMDLGKRGEKLLADNLEQGEDVLAKLRGDFGQGFVVAARHIYIIKWGFQAGSTFGGKCASYSYANITGLQIKKQSFKYLAQVLTPATQGNKDLSYWATRGKGNNAIESDNAVTFSKAESAFFQQAINMGREMMSKAQVSNDASPNDIDQLEKLADLRDKGVLTEQEFTAKKKQILGL